MSISDNSKPCICRYFRQKSANRAMSSMLACFRKWKEHLAYILKFEMSHLHVTMSLSIYCKWCHHRTIYALSRFSLTNFPIHVTFFICVLLTKVNRRQNMRKQKFNHVFQALFKYPKSLIETKMLTLLLKGTSN